MAQSLSKLYIHIIFRVKTTFKQIRKEDRNELYAYIGSVIKQNDSTPIAINGMSDHIFFYASLAGLTIQYLTDTQALQPGLNYIGLPALIHISSCIPHCSYTAADLLPLSVF